MTNKYVNSGDTMEYTASGVVASGAGIVVGDCLCVALGAAAASGDVITLSRVGRFTMAKTTGTAWNQGDKLDWDVSAQKWQKGLSTAIGDVDNCAIAAIAAASGDATGDVILCNPGTVDITT